MEPIDKDKKFYNIPFMVWLRNLLYLMFYRKPFQNIKYPILWALAYGLVYPLPRIIFGRERAKNICDSFLGNYRSTTLSLPSPWKSKIMMRWSDYGLYSEIYIRDVYCKELLKEGMNVIDVGAHIGTYTILAAEKIGKNGKIVAIEPEPQNYERLLENIKLNNLQNVVPIKIALTDHNGFEKLYLSSSSVCHSLIFKENKESYINVSVKILDKLLEELNLKRVDIIKIDAEGAEIPILKGAEKTLKANPNTKIIVAAERYPSQAKEINQFLQGTGFKTKFFRKGIAITI